MENSDRIHPKKFMLWVGFASMTMLFAGLTSALVVKKGDAQNWVSFRLPDEFLYSTIIIIISSLTIQFALNNYKLKKWIITRWSILATIVLSAMFIYLQLKGWDTLKAIGMPIDGNPSGSFVYAISGFHGVHYIVGIALLMLIYLIMKWSKEDKKMILNNNVNPNRLLQLELITSFWHYIGIVWVYIYILFKYMIYN